jgi:hypothetical protein
MVSMRGRIGRKCVKPPGSRIPAFATNKVASVAPDYRVLAALAHRVYCRTTTIGPPRVEIAIVVALTVRSVLAPLKGCSGVAIVALRKEVEGGSQNASGSRHGEEDGLE